MKNKRIGKVQSKRSKERKKKKNDKVLYFGVILIVSTLILFICSHFLTLRYGQTRQIWMGIEISNLITDIILFLVIFLSFIILIFWISFYIKSKGMKLKGGRKWKRKDPLEPLFFC